MKNLENTIRLYSFLSPDTEKAEVKEVTRNGKKGMARVIPAILSFSQSLITNQRPIQSFEGYITNASVTESATPLVVKVGDVIPFNEEWNLCVDYVD